jgi:RimJ/RimL family protein N-acetyltransferase
MKETRVPIGMCGLLKRDTLPDPDVGFAFLPDYWSQGYAFEAASSVMSYGREVLGLRRIVAITSLDNDPSIRLLKKIGMKFEGLITPSEELGEVRLFATES